jgi:hypothetical protein
MARNWSAKNTVVPVQRLNMKDYTNQVQQNLVWYIFIPLWCGYQVGIFCPQVDRLILVYKYILVNIKIIKTLYTVDDNSIKLT